MKLKAEMKIYFKFRFETKSKMIIESKSGTLIENILMNVMGHHTGVTESLTEQAARSLIFCRTEWLPMQILWSWGFSIPDILRGAGMR